MLVSLFCSFWTRVGAVGGGGAAAGCGVPGRRAGWPDADGFLVGAAVRGGRVGRAAPVAVDLGAGGGAGGADRERPAGRGAGPAPVGAGGRGRGCGGGGLRGRVVAVGAVRVPAGREGGGRGPG